MKCLRFLILAQRPLALVGGVCAHGAMGADSMGDMPGMADHATPKSGELTPAQKQFLASYEQVRSALAAQDLAAAKAAAAKLGDAPGARHIAGADSLAMARVGFKELSASAVRIAAGKNGYFVIHCPMAEADWVQTNQQVSNPYLSKDEAFCGILRK